MNSVSPREPAIRPCFQGHFSTEQRLVLDELPDAVLLTDASGNIYDTNSVFCQMLGYHRSELIGLHVSRCVDPLDLRARPPKEKEFLAQRWIRSRRHFLRKDGSKFLGDLHARRVDDNYSITVIRPSDA